MSEKLLHSLTAEIVANFVTANRLEQPALFDLIRNVHASLRDVEASGQTRPRVAAGAKTAAEVRKSIMPDGLVSFIDGKKYQLLRRHLTKHGLTPDGYRIAFGLPQSYPMVASNYSRVRSELARASGLGSTRGRRRR